MDARNHVTVRFARIERNGRTTTWLKHVVPSVRVQKKAGVWDIKKV